MPDPSPQSTQWSSSETFRESAASGRGAYWVGLGGRLKRRVNMAWWMQYFLPAWMGLMVIGGVGVLVLRNQLPELDLRWAVLACVTLVLVAALAAWMLAKRRFISSSQAFAKLDASRAMDNALTTAHAGVGHWPDPHDGGRDRKLPMQWRGGRLLLLILVPLLVFLVSCLVPVGAVDDSAGDVHRPAVWERINQLLTDHVLEDLADPERIEALQREMERLEDRPAGDWFDHASLETSDRIEQLLDAGLENMEENLSRAGNLVPRLAGDLADGMEPLDDQTREKLARQLQQAIEQLQNQPLGLNPEMAEKLMQATPEALRNMDQEQLDKVQELADQLREWAEKAGQQRDGQGQGEGQKPLWQQLLEQEQQQGAGGQDGGQGGEQPGNGGIERGPGEAPMSLKQDESNLPGARDEHLEGNGNIQPGEKIGETVENREVERVEIGPRAGGAAASEGQGGDRVWRQSLSPDEQNLLEGYFK